MPRRKHNLPVKVYYGMPIVLLSSLLVVYIFWKSPIMMTISLTIIALVQNWLFKFKLVKTFFAVALIGPLYEIVAIKSGAWQYNYISLFDIPIWLPILWGIAGLCFITAANYFNESILKND